MRMTFGVSGNESYQEDTKKQKQRTELDGDLSEPALKDFVKE